MRSKFSATQSIDVFRFYSAKCNLQQGHIIIQRKLIEKKFSEMQRLKSLGGGGFGLLIGCPMSRFDEPRQPADFNHPATVNSLQVSSPEDLVASQNDLLSGLLGRFRFPTAWLKGRNELLKV
jgi:hypothetical protein